MSTLRRRAREVAFQFLFHDDVAKESNIEDFFEHFDVTAQARSFAKELATGTLVHLPEIDQAIEKKTTNWRFSRLAHVDKTLIRLAVYEILFRDDIPPLVAINEAIELSKRFGSEHSPSFVNGILDAVFEAHQKSLGKTAESEPSAEVPTYLRQESGSDASVNDQPQVG